MSEPRQGIVRRRFLALLLLLLFLGIALFLIAIASVSRASPGPPLTQITSAPRDPSGSRAATFVYTNVFSIARFECSLDGSSFAACGTERPSTITYTGLAEGRHTFRVRAILDGRTGATASYEWTVELGSRATGSSPHGGDEDGGSDRPEASPDTGGEDGRHDVPTAPDGDGTDGTDGGNGGGGLPAPQRFTIDGDIPRSALLYPGGAPVTVPLRVRSSAAVPLRVIHLTVSIDSNRLPPGCLASWFRITQSNASNANPLIVPALGSRTLPAGSVTAPTIRMLDSGNQDACKRASVHLEYSGTAQP